MYSQFEVVFSIIIIFFTSLPFVFSPGSSFDEVMNENTVYDSLFRGDDDASLSGCHTIPDSARVENEKLILFVEEHDDSGEGVPCSKDFSCAGIYSRQQYPHGYFGLYTKFPGVTGVYHSIFLTCRDGGEPSGNMYFEYCFRCSLSGAIIGTNLLREISIPGNGKTYTETEQSTIPDFQLKSHSQVNEYGILFTPNYVNFYFNGAKIGDNFTQTVGIPQGTCTTWFDIVPDDPDCVSAGCWLGPFIPISTPNQYQQIVERVRFVVGAMDYPSDDDTSPDETNASPDETNASPDETNASPDETIASPDETIASPDETAVDDTSPDETTVDDTSSDDTDENSSDDTNGSVDETLDGNTNNGTDGGIVGWMPFVFVPVGVVVILLAILVCICIVIGVILGCRKKYGGNKNEKSLKMFDELDEKESSVAKFKFNKSLFTIKIAQLKVLKKIGKGGFCSVYLCEYGNIMAAFKSFDTKTVFDDENSFELFEKELTLISGLSHPNLCQFFGAVLEPPRCGLVLEYCSNGNLQSYIENHNPPTEKRVTILQELAVGLGFLHQKNVVHRDVKPENTLLNDFGTVKIIDFGLSKVIDEISAKQTRNIGTGLYMSPEVCLGKPYDGKSDVFSYGVVIWVALTSNFEPYGKSSYNVQVRVASDHKFRPNISAIDKQTRRKYEFLIDIMKRSWNKTPKTRPSFEEICRTFKAHLK